VNWPATFCRAASCRPRAKCAAAARVYSAMAVAATAPRLLVKVTSESHRSVPARFEIPAWV